MEIKTLLITINLDDCITTSDLALRYLLVDTIENRNLGRVAEESSSSEMIEIVLKVSDRKRIENDVKDLLTSLGYQKYSIQDISDE